MLSPRMPMVDQMEITPLGTREDPPGLGFGVSLSFYMFVAEYAQTLDSWLQPQHCPFSHFGRSWFLTAENQRQHGGKLGDDMATDSCENKEKAKPTTNKKLGVIWGFPKIRGTTLGVSTNEDYSILGSILGSPHFGKLR